MSKKKIESDREKDEDEDLDEGEGDEDEGDEDEEEESSSHGRRRARARVATRDDHDDDHGHDHGHDDEDEDDETDLDDPTWWAPHAVLAVLVMLGVLGFFGVFNKALGGIAAKPHGGDTAAHAATVATHTDTPKPTRPARPTRPMPTGETYGAKHLLVQYKGAMRAPASITRTEDEAKARATEAMKKAKADPSKFAEFVKEYSDEPGAAQRGGDLGTFRKGQMVPEFQNAVEKLKVNEVSGLVKTPFGYHVILRTK
jgi:hypothetical protein